MSFYISKNFLKLDGLESNITDEDIGRRNTIVSFGGMGTLKNY